ncbi:methyltransferase domain-containing protein [Streptomyces sp. TS71-3]|uniref:class I SAM-dependent methyltransferase n=1 Tax=Streptomyces sp. TS71-3 TaxID=2733862 RepID=UPI001B2E615F|nr:methyltransferase domain-containing protein [Streptomyces sp. TS71-3]GHJ35003.1 methyltransferase [Streptomyces sp. TS71-3]
MNDEVNDAADRLAALRTDEGRALLEEVRDVGPGEELAAATRLRRAHPPDLVSAALTQARLRRRAEAKFGAADARRMFFTADGVEQATRASVAAHRAQRMRALGVRSLADLCCGIGGDAIALARAGITVRAVDRSPLVCAVARANAEVLGLADRIEVVEADVTEVDTAPYDAVFADPARRVPGADRGASSEGGGRRGGRGRIFRPEDYSPPLSWAVETARRAPCAALKTAPGIPYEAIPEDVETEWISDGGEVKEAVLWFGTGAPPGRRATLLPASPDGPQSPGARTAPEGPPSLSAPLSALPPDPDVRAPGRYLYEPDGAVIRAHLVAEVAREVDGGLLDATIAYVTADGLRSTPFATAYEITDALPFNLKRLRALLRERGVGTLTVKKRGSAIEPEELRRKVRPQGPNSATVFLTRLAGAPAMLIGGPA